MFLHFDGDNVGNHIELLLIDEKLDKAIFLSEQIKKAMLNLKERLEKDFQSKVHIFAGDDLIVSLNHIEKDVLIQLCDEFFKLCKITISVGFGKSVKEALDNLRRAKLSGKNRVVGE